MATPERYLTIAEFKDRYDGAMINRLADKDNDGVADDEVIIQALGDAADVIDGFISSGYVTPVAEPTELLGQFTARIALYNLHLAKQGQTIPKATEDAYNNTIALLVKTQKGEYAISGIARLVSASGQSGSTYMRSNKSQSDKVFTKDLLRRFM